MQQIIQLITCANFSLTHPQRTECKTTQTAGMTFGLRAQIDYDTGLPRSTHLRCAASLRHREGGTQGLRSTITNRSCYRETMSCLAAIGSHLRGIPGRKLALLLRLLNLLLLLLLEWRGELRRLRGYRRLAVRHAAQSCSGCGSSNSAWTSFCITQSSGPHHRSPTLRQRPRSYVRLSMLSRAEAQQVGVQLHY